MSRLPMRNTDRTAPIDLSNRHPESGVIKLARCDQFRFTGYTGEYISAVSNELGESVITYEYNNVTIIVDALAINLNAGTMSFYGTVPGFRGLYTMLYSLATTYMPYRGTVIHGIPARKVEDLVKYGVPGAIAQDLIMARRTKHATARVLVV